jgi:hypothetical protein
MRRVILLLVLQFLSCVAMVAALPQNSPASVDIVLFSYNRPMQLYACLESIERFLSGFNEIHVVYRAGNSTYAAAYEVVWRRFFYVKPHPQGKKPKEDFKPLVVSSVYSQTSNAAYVMFGVDDDIVTDTVSLADCVSNLEKYHGWGFFFRLGKNINYTYTLNKSTPCPRGWDHPNGIFTWDFVDGRGDWGYPNNVDMTIYRKTEIASFLKTAPYTNPNTLEGVWDSKWKSLHRKGVCYFHSKVINIPMNLVNETVPNRHGHHFSPEQLLVKFQQGLKINIQQFHKINNRSLHEEHEPNFIKR